MAPTTLLTAAPGTDIWSKPPHYNIFSSPITFPPSSSSSSTTSSTTPDPHPKPTFSSARATILLPTPDTLTLQYDQAGLLILLGARASIQQAVADANAASSSSLEAGTAPAGGDGGEGSGGKRAVRYLKVGVERYEGANYLSVVGCDRWADWSVYPLDSSGPSAAAAGKEGEGQNVTVELRKEVGKTGVGLWVYLVANGPEESGEEGGERRRVPVREVCWVFDGADEKEGEEEMMAVGLYVARPERNIPADAKSKGLEVGFEGFDVRWD